MGLSLDVSGGRRDTDGNKSRIRSSAMNAPDTLLCAPRQHLPLGEEFLFLPPWVQPYAYRIVDKLFAHRLIRRGPAPPPTPFPQRVTRRGPAPRPLPYGPEIDPCYTAGGREYDVGAFMDRNAIV